VHSTQTVDRQLTDYLQAAAPTAAKLATHVKQHAQWSVTPPWPKGASYRKFLFDQRSTIIHTDIQWNFINTDFNGLPKNVCVKQSPCYPKSWKMLMWF